MDNETEIDEKRGLWRWILVGILCWWTNAFCFDGGLRSVLLGLGIYFNVIFIEKFISRQKFDYFVVRLISAIVFTLPCMIMTWILLNRFSPQSLNGTKTILLLSPIVYGVMFYLGVYISEKLKCPNWLTFLIVLLFMFFAGIFRMSAFLMYPASYGFMFVFAFGLVAMLTCIVCGGLFVSKKNIIVFPGLLLVAFVIGFFCNIAYGGGYKRELFCADKHNPDILKNLDYTLGIETPGHSVQLIFNTTGFNENNLEVKNGCIYNKKINQNIAKLIPENNNNDLVIAPDLTLKSVYNSNEIYLDNTREEKIIFIAHGHSPSFAEKIQRVFYINDGKVYSKNLLGKDEIFYCDINQLGKNRHSFSYVSPDGKFFLYTGPPVLFLGYSLWAIVELSSGKSHLVPEEYWWETSVCFPKVWISKKLLTSK